MKINSTYLLDFIYTSRLLFIRVTVCTSEHIVMVQYNIIIPHQTAGNNNSC